MSQEPEPPSPRRHGSQPDEDADEWGGESDPAAKRQETENKRDSLAQETDSALGDDVEPAPESFLEDPIPGSDGVYPYLIRRDTSEEGRDVMQRLETMSETRDMFEKFHEYINETYDNLKLTKRDTREAAFIAGMRGIPVEDVLDEWGASEKDEMKSG